MKTRAQNLQPAPTAALRVLFLIGLAAQSMLAQKPVRPASGSPSPIDSNPAQIRPEQVVRLDQIYRWLAPPAARDEFESSRDLAMRRARTVKQQVGTGLRFFAATMAGDDAQSCGKIKWNADSLWWEVGDMSTLHGALAVHCVRHEVSSYSAQNAYGAVFKVRRMVDTSYLLDTEAGLRMSKHPRIRILNQGLLYVVPFKMNLEEARKVRTSLLAVVVFAPAMMVGDTAVTQESTEDTHAPSFDFPFEVLATDRTINIRSLRLFLINRITGRIYDSVSLLDTPRD